MNDPFKARDLLKVGDQQYVIFRLDALQKANLTDLKRLPFSIRIMLEAALRLLKGWRIDVGRPRQLDRFGPAQLPDLDAALAR